MKEPVAEVIKCAVNGGQTLMEIDGRWKFLPIGTKLYTAADLEQVWQEATRLAMENVEREIAEFVALLDAQHRPSGAVIRANLLPRIRALSDVAAQEVRK